MKKTSQILSAMVYRNIVIIIAVGIIGEVFGVYGWFYNDRLLLLVNPIYSTLLPVLIAYTGGKIMGGDRGGTVAAIVVFGLTLSSSVPAILGAMLIGPLSGWLVKNIDFFLKQKVPAVGYELLTGNIIAAAVAVSGTILCFLVVGQSYSYSVKWAMELLESTVTSEWLPFSALMIEPAKVLFLNNVLSYGILGPLGIQQAKELGKSVFFLLEANPGPGLGMLLTYWLKSKGIQRTGAKLASGIHFFGGIHEVYFPYVLRKPILLIPLIAGSMTGIYFFQITHSGLVSIASPGSIILYLALSPKQDLMNVLIGVLLSAAISFLLSFILLRTTDEALTEEETRASIEHFYPLQQGSSVQKKHQQETAAYQHIPPIHFITFVCEAGLGSSAMGAAFLKKKVTEAGLDIEVTNASVEEIPDQADLIVCHQKIYEYLNKQEPTKHFYPLKTFTSMEVYDELIEFLKERNRLIGSFFHV